MPCVGVLPAEGATTKATTTPAATASTAAATASTAASAATTKAASTAAAKAAGATARATTRSAAGPTEASGLHHPGERARDIAIGKALLLEALNSVAQFVFTESGQAVDLPGLASHSDGVTRGCDAIIASRCQRWQLGAGVQLASGRIGCVATVGVFLGIQRLGTTARPGNGCSAADARSRAGGRS